MAFHGSLVLSLPHLVAGLIGLAAGAVALYALKGGTLHRRSGTIFACAMLLVAASGIAMAILKSQRLNLSRVQGFQWMNAGAMLLGLAVGLRSITLGLEAVSSATGRIDGLPAAPAFMFGIVALPAVSGDIRTMMRGVEGAPRIARHLWRMCFALFSSASSFFPAQVPKMFPASDRVGAIVVMIGAVLATSFVVHPSIANAHMGMMLPLYSITLLGLALVVSAAAGRRSPASVAAR